MTDDDDIPVDEYDGSDHDDAEVLQQPAMKRAVTVEEILDLKARWEEEARV